MMKKLSLAAVFSAIVLSACTADFYADKGNATILDSKDLGDNKVELTVQKNNGEKMKLTREYDAHATVGARVVVADENHQQDEDLKTIRRYEFK